VIITFYSYKGGVGRSMALMNVAEILADVGYDIIVCDFDLEAPGLERYVTDDLDVVDKLRASRGVIDLLGEYRETLAGSGPEPTQIAEPSLVGEGFCDINGLLMRRPSSCAVPVSSPNTGRLGRIRFLGAGRRDGDWATRYSEWVQQFDWSDFYRRWAGAAYVDFFREDLTKGRTIVLVDSRTGVTEHAGICTHHLADLVVLLTAPNDLNIDGTKWMANAIATADLDALRGGRPLQVIPVAARVETASQVEELAAFRERFEREFAASVPTAAGDAREFIKQTEIPYIPYFAFTEKVVARQNVSPHRELYGAYEALAQAVVNIGLDTGMVTEPKRRGWLAPLGAPDGITTALGRKGQVLGLGPVLRLAPRPEVLAGREELLAGLDARLAGDDGGGPRVVALTGLGGAGKTTVAVEYAHRHLAEFEAVWQFPAEDATVLVAGFADLAAQLGAGGAAGVDPVAAVHSVLVGYPSEWLLIFDNAPSQGAVQAFVPPAGNGRVLITSQSAVWPPGQAVPVPVLGTEVAAAFLVTRTGDPDRQAAADLAEELGGLPLALAQAAAFIETAGTTLAGYLAVFRNRRADLLARGEVPGHPGGVAAALGLALSRLGEESPAAAGLLRLLACLAPEPVPVALLLSDAQIASELDPDLATVVGPLLGDPVAAGDAVTALRRYSLVTPAGDGLVLVHRLVQAVTLDQMPADLAQAWRQAAAALVEAAIPADTQLPAAWPVCGVLLPHARTVLGLTSNGMWRIAQYLGSSGSYSAARDLFQLIADAFSEDDAYGPEHLQTLDARADLAYWIGEAGDAAGARDQFAALLSILDRVSGAEHPDTLTVRGNLARYTGAAGDAAGARDQYAALLPMFERVLGPEDPSTLTTRANLAHYTGAAGDAAGARDQAAALLPIRERVSGAEHPDTLIARGNLARWTGQAGDAAGARDQYAALVPIFERVLGPEHPETLIARANLAFFTGAAGDAAGARDQFAALLPVEERVLGSEHPDTLIARANLASWTKQAEREEGAR
jgi:MinD-like ATPase involved in chromosome partitioning or flagellar assembly